MKRIIHFLPILLLIVGCEQKLPEFDDFDYTTVYFPHQFPIRTLSMGEETQYDNSLEKDLIFHIAPNIGGLRVNEESWIVDFEIAESLAQNMEDIGGDTIIPMPGSYYTINPADQVMIPPGSFKGMIEVQLTNDFLNDPLAYGNHYVIPLVITGSSADSILSGKESGSSLTPDRRLAGDWSIPPKDFVLFMVNYVNPYHGTYIHRGRDIVYDQFDNIVDTMTYSEIYVKNDQLWDLKTQGMDVVHTNGTGIYKGGNNKMELQISEAGDIVIDSIEGADFAVTGTGTYVVDGGAWGGKDRDAIFLSYTFQEDDTLRHEVIDTLLFRNRGIKFETFTPVVDAGK